MRKASIVLAIAACAAASLSPAQHRDVPATDVASRAAAATSNAGADGNDADRGKSGFGQIMSMLTGLLQDAAGKEAAGASSTVPRILSSDQSAVTIIVTPVAGRSTFFVDKPVVDRRSRGRPAPGNATPPAEVAVTTIAAKAAQRAEVAMHAEGDVPD